MKIIHHSEPFDPRELIKKSETGDSPVQLDEQDYNVFLSVGTELHTFTATASGENRIAEALANAVSSEECDAVIKQSAALMVIIGINPNAMSSLKMEELMQVNAFIGQLPDDCDVSWGTLTDDAIGGELKVTIFAMLP